MKNTEDFVKSIHKKIRSLENEGFYCKEEIVENLLNGNVDRNYEDITDYDIAFWELYQENEKVSTQVEKYLELLSEQKYFRQDISSLGIVHMVREIRLPEKNASKWELLYETLLLPTDESGPILHLYFDGWNIIHHKIYYFDEMECCDNKAGFDNQNIQEEDIYDLITDSAKTRFDYQSFEQNFALPDVEINIADKTLWTILMYLAMGEKPNIVASKIKNEIMLLGFIIENKDIENVIINNQGNWEKEIGVLKMITDMLNSSFSTTEQIYAFAKKTLMPLPHGVL